MNTGQSGDFYFGCYWGDRPENAEVCAEHILDLTGHLARIDRRFGAWRVVVSTSGAQPLSSDATRLADMMRALNAADQTTPLVISLVSLLEGEEVGAALRVACGGCAGVAGILNSLVLEPVYRGYGLEPWLANACSILRAMVEAFDVDWGGLLIPEYRTVQGPPPRSPIVGALAYFADWRGEPPHGVSAERLTRGWLIDVRRDKTSLPLAEETAEARALLDVGKLLLPTPQTQT